MIQYLDFWGGFDKESESQSFKKLAEHLLGACSYKNVYVYSVFSDGSKREVRHSKDDLRVLYSGESITWDKKPEDFDLSYIMEETDIEKRIVCFPLFIVDSYWHDYWSLYRKTRPFNENKRGFCSFIVSNPGCQTRNNMFHVLSKYKQVTSAGNVFRNTNYEVPYERDTLLQYINEFKFMICFENVSKPCYLTEKLHNAWVGGAIPIYWGCTNVTKWLNPKAFLYLEDDSIESMIALVHRVMELDNDHNKYMEMYNQPLLIGDIPEDMDIDAMKRKTELVLSRQHV
jgi:hypothetical protein